MEYAVQPKEAACAELIGPLQCIPLLRPLDDLSRAVQYTGLHRNARQRNLDERSRLSACDDMTSADRGKTRFEHAHPILSVSNMARSLHYYVGTLGFTNAEWGGDDFTCVSRDGASIYLSEGDQGQPGTWVWVGVDDVERLHDELVAAGATILHPPENYPWACEMKVSDPDGHVLRFGSDLKTG